MLRKILKYSIRFLAIVISVISLYLVNLFLMKPFSIDHYLGKELALEIIESPESLTYIGIFDRFNWLTKHNSRLSIPEDDDLENDIKEIEKVIKTLYKYKDSNLTDSQINTKSIAIFDWENNLKELKEFPYHDYPLNQIGGVHLNTIQFMNHHHLQLLCMIGLQVQIEVIQQIYLVSINGEAIFITMQPMLLE